MSTFSLDDIREAAEKKYGALTIGDTVLLNPLRLPKDKRKALADIQELLSDDDSETSADDQENLMREMLLIVAKDRAKGQELIEWIGDDLGLLATVFNEYASVSQVGEASASQV